MTHLDDNELQRLLRNVDIPAGLADRLKEIPAEYADSAGHGPIRAVSDSRWRWSSWQAAVLALAVVLTGLGIYVLWPGMERDAPSPGGATIAIREPAEKKSVDLAQSGTESPSEFLNEIAQGTEQIEQLLLQMKIRSLEQRLAQVRQISTNRSRGIHQRESTSLILSLANESALRMGVDRSMVRQDLTFVVEQFPETRGAERAKNILSTEL